MFTSLPFHTVLSQRQYMLSYPIPVPTLLFSFLFSLASLFLFFSTYFSLRMNVIYTHILVSKLSRRHLLLLRYTADDVEKGHILLPLDLICFGEALFHKVPGLLIDSTYALHVSALPVFSCTCQILAVHMFWFMSRKTAYWGLVHPPASHYATQATISILISLNKYVYVHTSIVFIWF